MLCVDEVCLDVFCLSLILVFCLLICDFFFRARFVFVLCVILLLLDKNELLCTIFNA